MKITENINLTAFELATMASNDLDLKSKGVVRITHPNSFELILFYFDPKDDIFAGLLNLKNSSKILLLNRQMIFELENPFTTNGFGPLKKDYNYDHYSIKHHALLHHEVITA